MAYIPPKPRPGFFVDRGDRKDDDSRSHRSHGRHGSSRDDSRIKRSNWDKDPSQMWSKTAPPPPAPVPGSPHLVVERVAWDPDKPVVDTTIVSPGSQTTEQLRRARIASDYVLDFNLLSEAWVGSWPDPKTHLFGPDGNPRFTLDVDIWKPLVKAYFAWFCIPRELCVEIWAEIVDSLLRISGQYVPSNKFQAWAYGCLSKFFLEDRQTQQRHRHLGVDSYDPERPHNGFCTKK
jgi:hypothetical protein